MSRSVDFEAEFRYDVEVVVRRRAILMANLRLGALTKPKEQADAALEYMRLAEEAVLAAYTTLFSDASRLHGPVLRSVNVPSDFPGDGV